MIFQQLFESQSSTYTYLLADAETKEAVLIDSVLETVDRDLNLIEELGLKLKYVLDTHVHADHVTGAGVIRSRLGIQTAIAKKANVSCGDGKLSEGDELKFGKHSIQVLETPGHTDASLTFVCDGFAFTGDALLIRGCGRTDFQGGSSDTLFESVTKKLFNLPLETIVYPAHDYNGFTSSTIGAEIENNPRLGKTKTKDQFREIMTNLKLEYPKQIDRALPANQSCGMTSVDAPQMRAIPGISVDDLRSRINHAAIVDVRSAEEFSGELGHVPGAHQIALGDDLKNFLEGYEMSEEIIFVCRSGRRSEEAVKLAMTLGFEKVWSLIGGMQLWNERRYQVERGHSE